MDKKEINKNLNVVLSRLCYLQELCFDDDDLFMDITNILLKVCYILEDIDDKEVK